MAADLSAEGCGLELAGERIVLLASRAAWWPAQSTLLIADLHVGKEESFRRLGVAMPHAVLDESLERLATTLARTRADRLIVIGDLIHDRLGLSESIVERFQRWRDGFSGTIELVVGNHDRRVRELPAAWRLHVRADGASDGPFRYCHEPCDAGEAGVLWSGHLHPTFRCGGKAVPAFVLIGRGPFTQVILPAFTSFSRGPGFVSDVDRRVYAVASGHVLAV